MGGKDVALLGECITGALNQSEPDAETRDDVQRAVMVRRILGDVVLGDVVLAIFAMRDDMRALKGAMTK